MHRAAVPAFIKKMKHAYPLSVAIISLLFLQWGCTGKNFEKIPGYLYIRLKSDPTTLDPALIVDVTGAQIAAKLYNGLVRFNNNLMPVPDIAQSWSISPDGLTYRFILKRGIKFFNGRQLNAFDVQYSFERVLDPATMSPRTWVFSHIRGARDFMDGRTSHVRGIKVLGPSELTIQLETPFAPFINLLGLTTAYVVPKEEVIRWGKDFGFHGSGTGPFIIEKWHHSQYLMLKARKDYFGKKPLLTGIYYRIIPEDFTTLVEFEDGNIDILPEIPPSAYKRYTANPEWKPLIRMAPGLNTYYLGFNCQKEPFNHREVRRALNFAIDRGKILNALLKGRGTLASGPLPPQLRNGAPVSGYCYDPERAKKLLEKAGFPNGFSMTMYQSIDEHALDVSQAVQSYLKAIGIRTNIVQLEWSSFKEAVARGEAQSFWLSWWADYPDAENFLFPLFHSKNWGAGGNRSRFKNSKVDELLCSAVKIMDRKKRLKLYRKIERFVINEAPWVFFWHRNICAIQQPWVRGYTPVPLAVMEKGNCIYLDGR